MEGLAGRTTAKYRVRREHNDEDQESDVVDPEWQMQGQEGRRGEGVWRLGTH